MLFSLLPIPGNSLEMEIFMAICLYAICISEQYCTKPFKITTAYLKEEEEMFTHQIFWGVHIGTSHEQQTSSWKKFYNWQISATLFWEDRSSVSPWIENGQHVVCVLVSRVASLQECFHLVKEMIHQSDIVIVICWTKIGQFGKNKGAELGKQETNLFIHLLSCLAGIGVFWSDVRLA